MADVNSSGPLVCCDKARRQESQFVEGTSCADVDTAESVSVPFWESTRSLVVHGVVFRAVLVQPARSSGTMAPPAAGWPMAMYFSGLGCKSPEEVLEFMLQDVAKVATEPFVLVVPKRTQEGLVVFG